MLSNTLQIGGFSHVDSVKIGGISPVTVQTMWKDSLSYADLEDGSAVKRINSLSKTGCSLLRFAVPDLKSAEILGSLAQMVSMPLAADIHFNYKIALRCLDYPVAKLRINPGNIGSREKVCMVLEKAAVNSIPVRIGVNAGSLPQDLRKGFNTAQSLVLAAERELSVFKEFKFNNVLVSMKASGIADTIEANRLFSQRNDVPLHLGVTEAGPLAAGIVANTAALCTLLKEGIGDTIRVSLSDTMENEVISGKQIIAAASQLSAENEKLKVKGVKIISCPRCGRHSFDTLKFTDRWLSRLYAMDKDISVAIMGCEVNGPAEAKHADLGITGAGDKVLVFKHGRIIKIISAAEADKIFEEELGKL